MMGGGKENYFVKSVGREGVKMMMPDSNEKPVKKYSGNNVQLPSAYTNSNSGGSGNTGDQQPKPSQKTTDKPKQTQSPNTQNPQNPPASGGRNTVVKTVVVTVTGSPRMKRRHEPTATITGSDGTATVIVKKLVWVDE
jgi:hypothetical protein